MFSFTAALKMSEIPNEKIYDKGTLDTLFP